MPQFVLEAENHTTFLIVYFFNGDQTKMGEDIEKVKKNIYEFTLDELLLFAISRNTEIRVNSPMQNIYFNYKEVCSKFAIVVFLLKLKL